MAESDSVSSGYCSVGMRSLCLPGAFEKRKIQIDFASTIIHLEREGSERRGKEGGENRTERRKENQEAPTKADWSSILTQSVWIVLPLLYLDVLSRLATLNLASRASSSHI